VQYCWKVQSLFKNSKNGYYWIQPECASKPYRVYCDFSQSQDYLYLPNDDNRNFTSVESIQQFCAERGFNPVEIYNDE
jgi:hypothetical protein